MRQRGSGGDLDGSTRDGGKGSRSREDGDARQASATCPFYKKLRTRLSNILLGCGGRYSTREGVATGSGRIYAVLCLL